MNIMKIVDNDSSGEYIVLYSDLYQGPYKLFIIEILFKAVKSLLNSASFKISLESKNKERLYIEIINGNKMFISNITSLNRTNSAYKKSLGTKVFNNKWHSLVILLRPEDKVLYVYIDGRLIHYAMMPPLEIFLPSNLSIVWAGRKGKGELYLGLIKLCVYHSKYLIHKNVDLKNYQLIQRARDGFIESIEEEIPRAVDVYLDTLMPIGLADNAIVYTPYRNTIISFGGYRNGAKDPSNEVLEFNTQSHRWIMRSNMPYPRWGHSTCYCPINHRIYVFGGHNGVDTGSSEIQIYDLDSDKWSVFNTYIIFERGCMCAFVPDNQLIHIINHDDYGRPLQHVLNPLTLELFLEVPPPRGVRWGVFTYYKKKLYLVSGTNPLTNRRERGLFVYDIESRSWTVEEPPPVSLHGFIREWGWLNGKLYVAYGLDNKGDFYSHIYSYEPCSKKWEFVGYGLFARDGVAGYMAKDGFLYVIGGRDSIVNPRGLDFVEKINIRVKKVLIFSPYSDVYGFTGDTIEVIVLNEDNKPMEGKVTIYKNGKRYAEQSLNNGKTLFRAEDEGIYYVEYDEDIRSNEMVIVKQNRIK